MADANSPSVPCAAYSNARPLWDLCEDVMGGTPRMREVGEMYLPKAPLETEPEYLARKRRTEFFNAYGRTVQGLAGMVFRRNPTLDEEAPEPLKQDWENIDGSGSHGDVFSRTLFEDALAIGLSYVLVDYPAVEGNPSLADEERLNLRPYWCLYHAKQVISWRTETYGAATVLTQVVIVEEVVEPSGEFGEERVKRYRVFRRKGDVVTWALWTEGKDGTTQTKPETVVRNQTAIPLVPLRISRAKDDFRSPLLDLAYANIAHFQVLSDHRNAIRMASFPILVFKGRDTSQGKQAVGPNIGIDVQGDGDVKYVEHSGASIQQTREELRDIERRMGVLGLAMLTDETRRAETAEAKRLDRSQQDSTLAAAARALQDALETAFAFHAAYRKLDGAEVTVNMEFEDLTFDPAMVSALSNLQVAGQVSLDTLWEMLAGGRILPETFDADIERVRLLGTDLLSSKKAPPTEEPEEKAGAGATEEEE